ncbi:MAG: hypothetical protein JO064_03730 [Actinobacteria bacterium]|nr:hypothetical protein [Actinomycetota bacterium]
MRCLDCRYEYDEPPRGIKCACPRCGAAAWIAARIPPRSGDTAAFELPPQALEM